MKNIDFNFVADIYDAYVAVDFDIDFFNQYAKAAKGKRLELMCGTGRVSVPLLKKGIDSTFQGLYQADASLAGFQPGDQVKAIDRL